MTSGGGVQGGVPVLRLGRKRERTHRRLGGESVVVGVREAGYRWRRCGIGVGISRGLWQEAREGGRRHVGYGLEQGPLVLPLLSPAVLEPDLGNIRKG